MATVYIRDLSLRTIIGIEDWERKKEQDIVINISFDYDSSKAGSTDDIAYAVDYKLLKQRILDLVSGSRFNLIEKMAAEILKVIMDDSKIIRSTVTIDKPNALRFARSVGLSLSAVRS